MGKRVLSEGAILSTVYMVFFGRRSVIGTILPQWFMYYEYYKYV